MSFCAVCDNHDDYLYLLVCG